MPDDLPTYDVRLSEPAEADEQAAVMRIARFSISLAERWQNTFGRAYRSLSQLPRRFPISPDAGRYGREVRRMIIRDGNWAYHVLYEVFDATADEPAYINIIRIRPANQQQSEPLEGG